MRASQYIFKLNNYCNLDCLYCYQSYSNYKRQHLTRKTFDLEKHVACGRAAMEHILEGNGAAWPRLSFVLQGGEPLLCPKEQIDALMGEFRDLARIYDVELNLNVHSNGTRLDAEWCDILLRHDCSLTVSLDGPSDIHDSERGDHMGRPTHSKVVAGLRIALEQGVDSGCMCVISPKADGEATQAFFEALGVKRIGYLLPTVEAGRPDGSGGYGRFLKGAFDAWLDSPREGVRVQFFEATLRALAGKPSGLAGIGGYRAAWISFTSQGAIESGDPFGLCSFGHVDGEPRSAIMQAHANPFFRLQAQGGFVPASCAGCPVRDVCQGGFLAHRHDGAGGFDQPTYYCQDLLDFFTHVKSVIGSVHNENTAH